MLGDDLLVIMFTARNSLLKGPCFGFHIKARGFVLQKQRKQQEHDAEHERQFGAGRGQGTAETGTAISCSIILG